MEDLSHVFANDPDEGQIHHGNLPDEVMDHFAAVFAHKSGLAPHPGVYKGPKVQKPDGWETPEDLSGQRNEQQSEAIQNVADYGNSPRIPSSTPPAKKLPSMAPPPSAADLT